MILYLVRHAKSSWSDQGLSDHERPLNKRGLSDAPRMFERLRNHTSLPEVIISSDAARAAATARLLAEALDYDADRLTLNADLYHAGVEQIRAVARSIPMHTGAAAIVGHNPGMTWAANQLTDNLELDNLPTCGIVGIEFSVPGWTDIERGTLCYFDYPKNSDGPLLRSS